jgi:hypothetical protein
MGRSRRVEVGAKSERVDQELKGKLCPLFAYFFSYMVFFSFLLLEKKKMLGENV